MLQLRFGFDDMTNDTQGYRSLRVTGVGSMLWLGQYFVDFLICLSFGLDK
jgi:hypothetical protein